LKRSQKKNIISSVSAPYYQPGNRTSRADPHAKDEWTAIGNHYILEKPSTVFKTIFNLDFFFGKNKICFPITLYQLPIFIHLEKNDLILWKYPCACHPLIWRLKDVKRMSSRIGLSIETYKRERKYKSW